MIKTTKEDKKMEVYDLIYDCLDSIKPNHGTVEKLPASNHFDLFVLNKADAGAVIHWYLRKQGFKNVSFKAPYNWMLKKEYSNGSMIKVSYTEGDIMID